MSKKPKRRRVPDCSQVVVYTALYGDYDTLAPALFADIPGVSYVCFTDDEQPKMPPGWTAIVAPGKHFESPKRAACYSRLYPEAFSLFSSGTVSLYHDANFQLLENPRVFCARELRLADIALYKHGDRGCLYDEAQVCLGYKIADPGKLLPQVDRYRQAGMPEQWGLYISSVIARHHTPRVIAFDQLWWSEFSEGCQRNQISLPYALWKTDIPFSIIPGNITQHPAFTIHPHRQPQEHFP